MGERETPQDILPENVIGTALKTPMTRRAVALGSVAGILALGEFTNKFEILREIPYLLFDTYRPYREYIAERGFAGVDAGRWHELQFEPEVREVLLGGTRVSLETLESIPIDIGTPQTVIAKITGRKDPDISMPIVEAHVNGRRQLVPILQSEDNDSAYISLGEIDTAELFLVGTDSSRDFLDEVNVELFYHHGNPIHETILRSLPVVGLREDNISRYENFGQYDALENDIPFFTSIIVKEHPDDGRVMVAFWQGYSHESGGTSPQKLLHDTGRTFDVDASLMLTMTPTGEITEAAVQGERHAIHVTRYENPVKSIDPSIRVTSSNNMVRWGHVSPHIESSNIVTSFYPDEYWIRRYPDDKRQEIRNELKLARTVISLREIHKHAVMSLRSQAYTDLQAETRVRGQLYMRDFAEQSLTELGYPIIR